MAEVYLGVGIDATGARAGAAQFNSAADSLSRGATKAAAAQAQLASQIRYAKLALAAFAAVATRQVIKTVAEYSRTMSAAQAVTGATAAEMVQLQRITRELGATTLFSASQAAEGVKFLGMAGFETTEIIAAMPAVLDLAAAGALGLGEAADISSNIMSGFNIEASEMRRVADTLAITASSANTNIQQLGEAMKYVAPVARAAGITMEETAAAIGVLANNGIQGSMAGTSLRIAFSTLIRPTSQAQAALAQMGLTVDQVNPTMSTLETVINNLADAGMTAEQAFTIFGQRGASAMLALTASTGDLDKLNNKIKEGSGAAAEMAKIMRENLAGDIELLKSALSELTLAIGEAGAEGAIRNIIQTATQWVGSMSKTIVELANNEAAVKNFKDAMEVLKYAIVGMIGLGFLKWLGMVTIALEAAAAAGFLMNTAMAGGVTAIIGLLGYIVSIQNETNKWRKYTEAQTEALYDMAGAQGELARRTEIANLQMQRAQMRTTEQIIQDIERVDAAWRAVDTYMNNLLVPTRLDIDNAERQRIAKDQQLKQLRQELKMVEDLKAREDELVMKKVATNREYQRSLAIAREIALASMGVVTGGAFGDTGSTPPPAEPGSSTQSTLVEAIEEQTRAYWDALPAVTSNRDATADLITKLREAADLELMRNGMLIEFEGNMEAVNRAMEIEAAYRQSEIDATPEQIALIRALIEEKHKLKDANTELADAAIKKEQEHKAAIEESERAKKQWANTITHAFKDAIMSSKNLSDALGNLANRLQSLLMNKALDSILGGVFKSIGFAKGAAFQAGGVTAFASGGVVSQPTMFGMSGGRTGLMGEAGPEAIMPLTRTSSGDLGVKAVGGGQTIFAPQFNITIQGGNKEQNEDAANQVTAKIMRALDDKVMQVIIREKRSGGVLSGT